MCPATVTMLGPRRVGRATDDDLLREAVDEVRAVDVPAEVEPDERRAAPLLDGHDLAEQDRGVLREVVAGLAADDHADRRRDAGRSPPRRRRGRPAPRPPAPARRARRRRSPRRSGGRRRSAAARSRRPARAPPRTPATPSAQPAGPAWTWTVSIVRSWRGRDRERLVEAVLVDAELRRPGAAVGEARVVAGAGAGVDPDPDRRGPGARRPTRSIWLTASRLRWIGSGRITSRSRSETFVPV